MKKALGKILSKLLDSLAEGKVPGASALLGIAKGQAQDGGGGKGGGGCGGDKGGSGGSGGRCGKGGGGGGGGGGR